MHFPLYLKCLLLGTCLIGKGFGCPGLSNKIGDITSDFDAEVGSSINVICTLTVSSVDYDGVTYNVNSSNLLIKKMRKILGNVKVLNESSVMWSAENSTLDDASPYTCLLTIPEANETLIVCSTHVTIGYKPLPVSNFSCISYNYANLTCDWKKPFNPVRTKYSLRRNSIVRSIGCFQKSDTSCTWTVESDPIYKLSEDTLKFTLTGENSLGEIKQHFAFDHYGIILPNPPIFDVTPGQNSAVIHFRRPKGMYETINGWLYKLCYTTKIGDTKCEIFDGSGKYEKILINLVPFTKYEFKLSCRLKAGGTNMWSANATVTRMTHPDVPYLSPIVPPSALQTDVSVNSRNITVFWEPIHEEFHNGPNLCYNVSYYACDNGSKQNEIKVCQDTFWQVGNLPLDQCYMFYICPYNDLGVSLNCSDVTVNKTNSALPLVNMVTVKQLDGSTYNASWDPPWTSRNITVGSYTLFWCITPIAFECKGSLNWMAVNSTSVILKNLEPNFHYNFAVAANYPNYTTGMKPASCILYKKTKVVSGSDEVANIFIKALSSNSLRVEWRLDECFQRNIKEISVLYCPVNATSPVCTGETMHQNISSAAAREGILLKGLYTKTNYSVSFSALTYEGFHVTSGPAYESTFDEDIEPAVLIGTAVGIALTCFAVIVITIIGVYRLKKRIELEKNVVIKLPGGLDEEQINFHNLSEKAKSSSHGNEIDFPDHSCNSGQDANTSLDELIAQEQYIFAGDFSESVRNKPNSLLYQSSTESSTDGSGEGEKSSTPYSSEQSTSTSASCPSYVRIELAGSERRDAVPDLEIDVERLSASEGYGAFKIPSTPVTSRTLNTDFGESVIIPNEMHGGGKYWTNQCCADDANDSSGKYLGVEDTELVKVRGNSNVPLNEPVEPGQNFSPYVPIKSMVFLYNASAENKNIPSPNIPHGGGAQSVGVEDVRKSVEKSLSNLKQFSSNPTCPTKCQNSGYVTSAFCAKSFSANN